jgi:hypothetical protein
MLPRCPPWTQPVSQHCIATRVSYSSRTACLGVLVLITLSDVMSRAASDRSAPVCAKCGKGCALKRCAGCQSVFYCSGRCQLQDLDTHRSVCETICITVRCLSGDFCEIRVNQFRPIREIKSLVFDWAWAKTSGVVADDFAIDLLHEGTLLWDCQTIAEVGVVSGGELALIGKLDQMPDLVDSSDSTP